MIHYHGTPITPRERLLELAGRNFCVPWPDARDVAVCHEIGQSVMLDNGAYTFWRKGRVITDWSGYYRWAEPWLDHWTTWAVIPDVIDGSEHDNDLLISEWPFAQRGAPVWHMHESVDRLIDLTRGWDRVCVGSSGQYAQVGSLRWHERMIEVMSLLCGDGPPPCPLHMLRGLKLATSPYPFASADSSSIAQNHGGNNTRRTPKKDVRQMADDIDGFQCPPRWRVPAHQDSLFG